MTVKEKKTTLLVSLLKSMHLPGVCPFKGNSNLTVYQILHLNISVVVAYYFKKPDSKKRSVQKKSSHCLYNKFSLPDIDGTWQPRRVDWNAHV